MILKVVSEGSYGSNLVQMDVGSADRLARHDLHITEQISNCVIPPYLFNSSILDQDRRTSSRLDAILVTPCLTGLIDHVLPPHIKCSAVREVRRRCEAAQLQPGNFMNQRSKFAIFTEWKPKTVKTRGLVPI